MEDNEALAIAGFSAVGEPHRSTLFVKVHINTMAQVRLQSIFFVCFFCYVLVSLRTEMKAMNLNIRSQGRTPEQGTSLF